MKKFDINKMKAEIDSGTLDIIIYYDCGIEDIYPVAHVPVINGTKELEWDVSKAYYQSGTSETDVIADEIMKAIPEVMENADLFW